MESQYVHVSVCKKVMDMSFQTEGALMRLKHLIPFNKFLRFSWNTSHYFIYALNSSLTYFEN